MNNQGNMIVNYEEYLAYDQAFQRKYGHLFHAYPYAMIIFDTILRHNENENKTFSQNAIKRLKSQYKYNLKTFARRPFYLISAMINRQPAWEKSLFVDLSKRFAYLSSRLEEVCRESGVGIVRYCPLRSYDFKLAQNRDRLFADQQIFSPGIKNTIKKITFENLPELISNKKLLHDLNGEIERNVEKLAAIMNRKKIRLCFTSGDQVYIKQFFCAAAQKAGIPYYVLLHGYTQGAKYIGVLPIHANKLLVWNNDIKNRLSTALTKSSRVEEKDKIEIFGYPIYDGVYVKKYKEKYREDPRRITFISQPFEEMGVAIDRETIYSRLQQLKMKGFDVVIRLHPKEKTKHDKIALIKHYDLDISDGELLKDLIESRAILGFNSSVIYEAKLLQKHVFQIKGLNINYLHEDVSKICIDEIPELGSLILQQPAYSGDDRLIADFKEKLKMMLDEVNVL